MNEEERYIPGISGTVKDGFVPGYYICEAGPLLKITPYAKVDTTLVGVPGDTKTVPSWNYIGDAEDVAEGAEVGLSKLTASTTTFTIKKAGKAVGITEEARLSGLGNPIGQAETQLAKSIAPAGGTFLPCPRR